ncbi:MAG: hypothetical protein QF473_09535 [Planctomycetota bacterium]|nr:hypothetical protein [Planctomycetota bacterium]
MGSILKSKRGTESIILRPAVMAGLFLLLCFLWLILHLVAPSTTAFRTFCSWLGFPAAACLLFTYLYPVRRLFLHRSWGSLRLWLRLHAGAAFIAFGLAILHSRGHASGFLTFWSMFWLALVMASGVGGYLLQKFCYRLMGLMVKDANAHNREAGLQKLDEARNQLAVRAEELVNGYSLLTRETIKDWRGFCDCFCREGTSAESTSKKELNVIANVWSILPAPVRELLQRGAELELGDYEKERIVRSINEILRPTSRKRFYRPKQLISEELPTVAREILAIRDPAPSLQLRLNRVVLEQACQEYIEPCDEIPITFKDFFTEHVGPHLKTDWPGWGWFFTERALEPIPRNYHSQISKILKPSQQDLVDELWRIIEARRQLDLEYWLHRASGLWLLLHGPASIALFLFVALHLFGSLRFGNL